MDPEEQARLKRIYEQQKVPATVMKSKESSGMASFLKREDPQLSSLKRKYFDSDLQQNKHSAFKPGKEEVKHWSDVETLIERQKRRQPGPSLRQRWTAFVDEWFRIRIDGKSVYVWHARRL